MIKEFLNLIKENIVETNTDDSYYTLLGDNRDWIDEENIYIYDSKRTKKTRKI